MTARSAEAAYAQALQAAPRDADLLNDVGYFHYECGDPKRAEDSLRQALEIDPKHRRAWINLGLVLGEQRRYDESYEAFARVLTPAEARSNVGVILARQGRHDEARSHIETARKFDSGTPALPKALAIVATPAETALAGRL